MDTFIIQGDRTLKGAIEVRGAKNAAGPILAATTLVQGDCVLHNMPRILDIEMMVDILRSMGASAEWIDDHSLKVNCAHIDPEKIDHRRVAKIRLSILFLGCLAQRFGTLTISVPGGCNIGSRPLDAHFAAIRDLGFTCTVRDNSYSIERAHKPASSMVMSEFSVTATENVILASVLGNSSIRVECCASEPHVQDLCWFLESCGAHIAGIGTHTLTIQGVEKLHPSEYTIIPDPIELGTFVVLAAATHTTLRIENATPAFLRMGMKKFEEVGIEFAVEDQRNDSLGHYEIATVIPKKIQTLQALKKVHCMPYPGFPADLVQPFALLMTQAQGITLVHDWMYDGRLRYVSELQKMGANITVLDPHRILIVGPTPLYGKEIVSYDLRAGATMIVAALIAEGTTTIHGIQQVDRGYEAIDSRLNALGAGIQRV